MNQNPRLKVVLDSLQPEVSIPMEEMSPHEFADFFSQFGIVCPEGTVFSKVTCAREDFDGDRYDLSFTDKHFNQIRFSMSVTLKQNPDEWILHYIKDARTTRTNINFSFDPRCVEYLTKMDTGDFLQLHRRDFTTPDSTIFLNDTVYTGGPEEITVLELTPVELINIVLASKPGINGKFTMFE